MPNPDSSLALDVRDLTVSLDGNIVVDKVSFSIPAGQTAAIIGPNGAGKSVLLKTLIRLLPKQSGTVSIFGVPHERYQEIAHAVSYVPQRLPFDQTLPLTIHDVFSLKSKQWIGMSRQDNKRMHDLLAMVGLRAPITARIATLSGGQMQRLLIAYSLMDNPRLLFLDEPSAGIDVQGQETVYMLLKRIQKTTNLTIVLVSHELEVVLSFCDQVLCLNKKLFCAGVPKEVLSHELLETMYHMPLGHFIHHHDSAA